MILDLRSISECVKDIGFTILHEKSNCLDIEIAEGIIFTFKNMEEVNDNAFGFKDTPWHSHDKLLLNTKGNEYVELNDIEIIAGIRDGDILLCEQYLNGILSDRWLRHKDEKYDNKFIEAGEEIRISRYPFHSLSGNGRRARTKKEDG